MITIKRLDHIQIYIPFGKGDEAKSFYGDILKFKEIPKSREVVKNGELWYEVGEIKFHLVCEDKLKDSNMHIAFEVENIKLLKESLNANGVKIKHDITIIDGQRFSIIDPFNNKIEFIEKAKNHSKEIVNFWEEFIRENPAYKNYSIPQTDFFCDEEMLTNQLAHLVKNDIKTATCGALIDYQITGDSLPKENELKIIIDWGKKPICITKTKSVIIKKFNEVDEEFAIKEGEGDRSLAYWKQGHQKYFSNYLKIFGIEFTEEIELVCEEFERIG
jgi:uncharacterized protein YhfF/predicted enzyme related to lactoylglutathione lyase